MKRLLIHRHPHCARCERIVRRHRFLDWLDRVADTTDDPPGQRAVGKGEIVVQDLETGALLEGGAAVEAIFRQIPLYWPLLPLLDIPWLRSRADRDARGGRTASNACGVAKKTPKR